MEGEIDIKKQAAELDELWKNTKPAEDFQLLPKCEVAIIVVIAAIVHSLAGTLGLNIKAEITKGKNKGRVIFHTFWLSKKNLTYVMRDLEKFGCHVENISGIISDPTGLIVGKTAIAKIGKEEYEGAERNVIKQFKVAGGQMELPGA